MLFLATVVAVVMTISVDTTFFYYFEDVYTSVILEIPGYYIHCIVFPFLILCLVVMRGILPFRVIGPESYISPGQMMERSSFLLQLLLREFGGARSFPPQAGHYGWVVEHGGTRLLLTLELGCKAHAYGGLTSRKRVLLSAVSTSLELDKTDHEVWLLSLFWRDGALKTIEDPEGIFRRQGRGRWTDLVLHFFRIGLGAC